MDTHENDIFHAINEETRAVANTHLYEPSSADFEDGPDILPESEVIDMDDTPDYDDGVNTATLFDADKTTEIAVQMLDSVQSSLFTILQKRQLIKRYFTDTKAYKQGREIAHMDDDEIKAKFETEADKMLGLKRRYMGMTKAFSEMKMDIPLSDEECEMLTPSLKRMVEKSGVDIPPNLAFVIAIGQIAGSRLAAIYWD